MGAILDRMKQFFNRMFKGKETKLLPSGEPQANKKKDDFFAGIRVDTEDKLNPEIYKGDRLLSNILMSLGVKKEIAENPRVVDVVSKSLASMSPDGRGWYDVDMILDNPTQKDVDELIKLIKSNKIMGEDERRDLYQQDRELTYDQLKQLGFKGNKKFTRMAFEINPENGAIVIQKLSRGYLFPPRRSYKVNAVNTTEISNDENGGVVIKTSNTRRENEMMIGERDGHPQYEPISAKERATSDTVEHYDSNGILLTSQYTEYGYRASKVDGEYELEPYVVSEVSHKRDESNPFVCQVEEKSGEKVLQYYYTIDPRYSQNLGKEWNSVFTTRDEAQQVFEKEKKKAAVRSADPPTTDARYTQIYEARFRKGKEALVDMIKPEPEAEIEGQEQGE